MKGLWDYRDRFDYSLILKHSPSPFILEMHSHCPVKDSFHNVTSLSPDETAKMLPVTDQLTLHTTSGNLFNSVGFQLFCPSSVQMTTVPSCEHVAIMLEGSPRLGAHATSRIQSLDFWGRTSACHWLSWYLHILTKLSQPPETKRGIVGNWLDCEVVIDEVFGAHEIAFTPIWCAGNFWCSHVSLKVWIEIHPSDDAAAKHRPNSCGAQATALTDDSCLSYS